MSAENSNSLYQEQKKIKPKIEEIYSEHLEGDIKKAALDFVAYMREKKMTPGWTSANSRKCNYKGKGVCYLRTSGTAWDHTSSSGSWSVTLYGDYIYGDSVDQYHDFITKENYQDIIWNNRALKKC